MLIYHITFSRYRIDNNLDQDNILITYCTVIFGMSYDTIDCILQHSSCSHGNVMSCNVMNVIFGMSSDDCILQHSSSSRGNVMSCNVMNVIFGMSSDDCIIQHSSSSRGNVMCSAKN